MTTTKGGRPATGSVKWRFNPKRKIGGKLSPGFQWFGRIKKPDGSRPFAPLDPTIGPHEEERARQCAVDTAKYIRENPHADEAIKETSDEWVKRFHAHKEKLGLSSVADMRTRWRKYVSDEIGHKDPSAVAREDLERIVRRLDREIQRWIASGGKRGEGISPSTAANVWGDVVHAFDEMVRSKEPSLRVLQVSPCANVRGPEAGDDRQGQILYSDELLALLRGVPVDQGDKAVPHYRRQVYAGAVYTKSRASELRALMPDDVDLAHAAITIDKQAGRGKNKTKTKRTKTRKVRTIDIEPNVLPLIEWLLKHPQGKGGRLLRVPPAEDLAELLRRDLWTVGVRRKALHESDELQRAIVFHDLRDCGLVHMAVRGDHPQVIQWTAGHTDPTTTQGYLDRGRLERQRIGEPLPPLPVEVLPDTPPTPPTGLDPGLDPAEPDEATLRESLPFLRPYLEEFRTAIVGLTEAA